MRERRGGGRGDEGGDQIPKPIAGAGDMEVQAVLDESPGKKLEGGRSRCTRRLWELPKHMRWSGGCGLSNIMHLKLRNRLRGDVAASRGRLWMFCAD